MNSIDVLVLGYLERFEDGSVNLKETWSTSSLIRTDDGHVIVVDTSSDFMRSPIKSAFKQIGKIFPDDVDMVVLTHCHTDHIGNVSLFKNATVYVHEGEECTIPNAKIVKEDTEIAKNYLDEDELRVLNNLVSGYFDFAEISAIEHRPMYMKDYIQQLDAILSSGGRKLLADAGSVSHAAAIEKAHSEYRKYQQKTLTPVEEAYLQSIRAAEKEVKTEQKKGKNNA